VTGEGSEVEALDAYIRSKLTEAAETYASGADMDAKLQAILASGTSTARDGPDSRG
jgi:hypothetical protein